jgi:hypothetical protein
MQWDTNQPSKSPEITIDEAWKHCAKWMKTERKGHIVFDSIYMKCVWELKPQNQKVDEWPSWFEKNE